MKFKFCNKTALIFTLFVCSFAHSQIINPFKKRYQDYIKGDIKVLANNVVNRTDAQNQPIVPFDNVSNHSMMNDEYEMFYIDIDRDASTFCSTSANLSFENETTKKIVYAALYWSGTYKYEKGILTKSGKFIPSDSKRHDFSSVKIKLPGDESYRDIQGKVIFDGIEEKEVVDFAPYVAYADITNFVKSLKDPSGTYTVANVKATQGVLSGGVAAGWTLFLVYEDPSKTGKFITAFDGFAGVTDNVTDVKFDGFQTLPNGNIDAKIVCAALEGDLGLSGDQLLFKTKATNNFTPLFNTIRKPNNFFTGCITNEDQYVIDRVPNSKNTLGYDTCLITIPNENNSVIANNSSESILRLKSTGDRIFMFFTAYSVEVTEPSEDVLATIQKEQAERQKEMASITPKVETSKAIDTKNTEVASTEVEVSKKTRQEIKSDVKSDVKGSIKNEVKQQVLADKESMKDEILKGMKADLIAELKNEIETEIKDEVKREVKDEVKEEFKKEYKKRLKKELKDQLKTDISESLSKEEERENRARQKEEEKRNKARLREVEKERKEAEKRKKEEEKQEEIKEKETVTQVEEKKIEETAKDIKPADALENQSKSTPSIVYEKMDNIYSGYYLVANVFSNPINASNFIKSLESKGLKPKSFFNATANLTYVYLAKTETEEAALKMYESKLDGMYQNSMWILVVFKENK